MSSCTANRSLVFVRSLDFSYCTHRYSHTGEESSPKRQRKCTVYQGNASSVFRQEQNHCPRRHCSWLKRKEVSTRTYRRPYFLSQQWLSAGSWQRLLRYQQLYHWCDSTAIFADGRATTPSNSRYTACLRFDSTAHVRCDFKLFIGEKSDFGDLGKSRLYWLADSSFKDKWSI